MPGTGEPEGRVAVGRTSMARTMQSWLPVTILPDQPRSMTGMADAIANPTCQRVHGNRHQELQASGLLVFPPGKPNFRGTTDYAWGLGWNSG